MLVCQKCHGTKYHVADGLLRCMCPRGTPIIEVDDVKEDQYEYLDKKITWTHPNDPTREHLFALREQVGTVKSCDKCGGPYELLCDCELLDDGFLTPEIVEKTMAILWDGTVIDPYEDNTDLEHADHEIVEGWFARMSNEIYHEYGEWFGPYKSKKAARAHLGFLDEVEQKKLYWHLTQRT